MEITERLELPCAPSELFPHIDDLERYPPWMRLVHAAERVDDPDDRPAWTVELRARVGPLARSKRLRMVRSETVADQLAVFERAELDGRVHARWALRAELEPTPAGSALTQANPQHIWSALSDVPDLSVPCLAASPAIACALPSCICCA